MPDIRDTTLGARHLVLSNYIDSNAEALAKLIEQVANSANPNLSGILKPVPISIEELTKAKVEQMNKFKTFKEEKDEIALRLSLNGNDFSEAYRIPEKYLV